MKEVYSVGIRSKQIILLTADALISLSLIEWCFEGWPLIRTIDCIKMEALEALNFAIIYRTRNYSIETYKYAEQSYTR